MQARHTGQQAHGAAGGPALVHANAHRVAFRLWPGGIYMAIAACFVLISTWQAWPLPESAFRSDNSPVSWLCSAQLWALAILALRMACEGLLPPRLGVWFGVAMAVMACDEQFMFHEQWKFGCQDITRLCQYGAVRNLPMIMVGLVGPASALWLHASLPPGRARLLLWLSIAVGLFSLFIHFTALPDGFQPYEEAFEVLAEALFLFVFLGLHQAERS